MQKFFFFSILLISAFLFLSCKPTEPVESPDDTPITYISKQARSTKRGISFNNLYAADFIELEKGVSWGYNWAAGGFNPSFAQVAADAGVMYYPMVWNGSGNWASQIRTYKAANPDCEYILAFNEPNLTDQANMTPAQAAARWAPIKELAQELNMKVVAPAMNYGTLAGYSDPITWLDEFFTQPGVSIDDVSALAIHCYMNVPSAVKSYVERFRKYNKPVWMTEFCAWEGDVSVDKQRSYMSEVINYFEAEPLIERYSWFKYDGSTTANPRYGLRPSGNNNGDLSDLGKIYIYMSSLDKNLYYSDNEVVPAEHYSNSNVSETVGADNAAKSTTSVQLNVSSDISGILEVGSFGLPKWLEYNIAPAISGNYKLSIRYASSGDSKCKIFIDNVEATEIDLPKTGDYSQWATITTPAIPLKAGQQVIRFTPSKGMISMNWWRFKR